ncbi:mitogen-activated protein kinase 15 isoform X1 [Falco peregrinus]|nr:mitogen-activated protein kinase 15 isoform X1 [Falco peregrinus]XP_055655853.1 mitogen-activated protein kinase 15 isoform X1 [Falco peregrinus]XP_055655854.1 mitogen-activated protein kinase 15 isoform X1 [Falco peregrinus]XP_055655855.1 mitogen-activated protein kinase 15 isoform X1 [Falco peregrinus]XP_055655856.1 mitogen-activated protein kinase 15 isoform X1 [Falco peregrinus]
MSEPEVEALVSRKYEIKKRLGKGAYGIVWKAINRKTGEIVAVKKIFDAFRNRTDAQRTFREVMFLKEFGEHPNVIKLLDVIRAQNDKDIYLIFESMETDLHAVIMKGNLLKDIHKCYILYQLLKATKFIHSGNVIHRDQKPSNILLDADCFVKLCDFGLARSLCQMNEDQGNPALTEYVATRWYRAPEILLSSRSYTKGVDMWSIGCILGEMLLGKPLFPGTSTMNQIEQILRVIPAPSPEDIMAIQSDYRASVINCMSSRQRVTFEEILPSSTPLPALDLLKKLLVFNPDKRLTAEEALQHPYVKRFHCPAREPSLDYDVILPLGDDIQLSVGEYRNKLYEVILGKKLNSHPKEQVQRENIQLSQSESRPLPDSSSVTLPTRKGQRQPTLPLLKTSYVHAGTTSSVQPEVSSRSEDLGRALCQRSKISVIYNPITHTVVQNNANSGAVIRNCSAPPFQQARISNNRKLERRITWANANAWLPPTSVQNLYNNPRNTQFQSKDVHPLLKPSKKMFQITANVGAAGDPKAFMGSYSQAYGTICKSALQSLPISKSSQQYQQ